MGENKKFRKQIAGYSEQIEYHQWKISEELKKDVPNMERIGHWEAEIRTFEENIRKLERKLNKR